MQKKHIFFHLLYYVLTPVVYLLFFYIASLFLDLSGESDNLGAVMAVTYAVLFFLTPLLITVLMRFSLFRWYVDPIAAAEIPALLYFGMIVNQFKRSGTIRSAFLLVNNSLSEDGGMGRFFIIGLFVFGLLASLSFARKNGQSISYRILSKITKLKWKGHQNEEKDSYSFHNRDTCIGIGVFFRFRSSADKVSRIL